MNLICALLALVALASCATHKTPETEPNATPTLADVQATAAKYQGLLDQAAAGNDGWISKSCDALLFSSLFAAATADAGYIASVAEDAPGHWLRRAPAVGSCTINPGDTTISKDMLVGLTWWAWRLKQPQVLVDLTNYGEAHAWVMGSPADTADELGKVEVTPALAGLMYQTLYKLGGPDHPSRHIPDVFPAGLTGFEAHLQVLGILLHAEVDDTQGVTDVELQRLRDQVARQPKNPLFAAALSLFDSSYTQTVLKLLSDESQWPKDALPTNANHCEPWAIQRDDGADWQPCAAPNPDTMYGADFVWTVGLLTKK